MGKTLQMQEHIKNLLSLKELNPYLKLRQLKINLEKLGRDGMLLYVPKNISWSFQSLGTTFMNMTVFALPLFCYVFPYDLQMYLALPLIEEKKKKKRLFT